MNKCHPPRRGIPRLGAPLAILAACGAFAPAAAADMAPGNGGADASSPPATSPAPAASTPRASSSSRDGVFPVRGRYNFGQAGARFAAGRGGRSHEGQDIMAACGTPVVAAAGGRVSMSRFQALAGNYVVIDGPTRDYVYMHLATPSPLRVGARVTAGDRIGSVGATGNARGCHLHFEIWTGAGYRTGGPIDPLPTLRAWGG